MAAAIALLAWVAAPDSSWLDDAYITLHSAKVVLSGVDARYDQTPALTGATSPVHVALVASAVALGASDAVAMRLMIALGLAAYVGALWFLSHALQLDARRQIIFLLLGLTTGEAIVVSMNGLETGIAIALGVTAIAAGVSGRPTTLALATGLMPWVRPDLAVMALGLWSWQLWRTPRLWKTFVMVPLAVGLPVALWLWLDTGSIVPTSLAAKQMFFVQASFPLDLKWDLFRPAFVRWLLRALPVSVGLAFAWRSSIGCTSLATAAITLATYLWNFPDAVDHNWGRYTAAIVLPVALYGTGLILSTLHHQRHLILACLVALAFVPDRFVAYDNARQGATELQDLSTWVDTHVPPTATIVVHDAGVVTLRGQQPLVDLVGLKTPHSVDAHARWTWPSQGRRRMHAIADIIRDARPDYLIVTDRWDATFHISSAARLAGYTLELLRRPGDWPLDEPGGGNNGYFVYRLRLAQRPQGAAVVPASGRCLAVQSVHVARAPRRLPTGRSRLHAVQFT